MKGLRGEVVFMEERDNFQILVIHATSLLGGQNPRMLFEGSGS